MNRRKSDLAEIPLPVTELKDHVPSRRHSDLHGDPVDGAVELQNQSTDSAPDVSPIERALGAPSDEIGDGDAASNDNLLQRRSSRKAAPLRLFSTFETSPDADKPSRKPVAHVVPAAKSPAELELAILQKKAKRTRQGHGASAKGGAAYQDPGLLLGVGLGLVEADQAPVETEPFDLEQFRSRHRVRERDPRPQKVSFECSPPRPENVRRSQTLGATGPEITASPSLIRRIIGGVAPAPEPDSDTQRQDDEGRGIDQVEIGGPDEESIVHGSGPVMPPLPGEPGTVNAGSTLAFAPPPHSRKMNITEPQEFGIILEAPLATAHLSYQPESHRSHSQPRRPSPSAHSVELPPIQQGSRSGFGVDVEDDRCTEGEQKLSPSRKGPKPRWVTRQITSLLTCSRVVAAKVLGWLIFILVILHEVVSLDSDTGSTHAPPTRKHRQAIRQLLTAAKDATLELERSYIERSRIANASGRQHSETPHREAAHVTIH